MLEENLSLPAAAVPAEVPASDDFHTAEVITVAAAHGVHDTYFSYLPTILPLMIQNLGLTTLQGGLLSAAGQVPSLFQPFIGALADRKNLKMVVVLAPTFSGMLVTLAGVAPSFGLAALLLLLAGFSNAGFHAISPAMVSARAGRKVGRGMGFFMTGGELGFGLGPLIVVAVIGALTLAGLPWLMSLGMLASLILFFRLKDTSTVRSAQAQAGLPVRQALAEMKGLMLPILGAIFMMSFLNANIVNYLPTFMSGEGSTFAVAGISLAIVELAGTGGTLLMSLVSDRLGQRNVALFGILASSAFSLAFLAVSGWLQLVMLVGVGVSYFVTNPAFLSMIQVRFTSNRALANGMYMSGSFVVRSIVVVIVGALADRFGMRPVFAGSALVTLLAVPLVLMLPKK